MVPCQLSAQAATMDTQLRAARGPWPSVRQIQPAPGGQRGTSSLPLGVPGVPGVPGVVPAAVCFADCWQHGARSAAREVPVGASDVSR
eukprot:Skav227400  [mRNA]  locus=scaffold3215:400592:406915:- [translate_table: standard]